MFKFDFAATEDGEQSSDDQPNIAASVNNDVDTLIHKLQQRYETSECTIVNASAQSLSISACNDNSFQPKLNFLQQERVDLHCSDATMDPYIQYVIPRHTLTDDTTDLIPGVYEGGLKVWECSVDLCRFLSFIIRQINSDIMHIKEDNADHDLDDLTFIKSAVQRSISRGGSTLELGCGHGLPGCFILRENIRNTMTNDNSNPNDGDTLVVFSDFNDFVLQHATIPNAQINVSGLRRIDGIGIIDECSAAQCLLKTAVFVGGDWMGLSNTLSNRRDTQKDTMPNDKFDLILAAETTYTRDACYDTAFLMAKHLKENCGVGLVATKRFYFGVGGGTDMLSDAINKINSSSNSKPVSEQKLVMRIIKSFDTGNANIRDLLEVRCVQNSSN
eukprot:scaffold38558_cov55-Cyclotella_meneghiniana.AAC.5